MDMTTQRQSDRTHRQFNQSEALTFPGLAQAVRAGDLVVLSGQVAFDDDGALVGQGDAAAQAEQCFANITKLLGLAGAAVADVVRINCFLADVAVYPAYAQAKARFLGEAAPAGTAVVAGLLRDDFLLEVEVIAFVGGGRP